MSDDSTQILTLPSGTPVKYRHQRAMELWYETGDSHKAEAALAKEGITLSASYIRDLMCQPWWKEGLRRMLAEAQAKFTVIIAENAPAIAEGLVGVSKGVDKTDKTANARVRAAEVFSTMGPDPLIRRGPQVQITHNTQINNAPVGESTMKGWTLDQLNEYARTGKKPEEG